MISCFSALNDDVHEEINQQFESALLSFSIFVAWLTALLLRNEEVGIYSFLFYRNCYWVPAIVDHGDALSGHK